MRSDSEVLNPEEVVEDFASFVRAIEPGLQRALVAAYGVEVGREVTRDALAYAWEHWNRLSRMENPAGYLYRVGQSESRNYRRQPRLFPELAPGELPHIEPGLPSALAELSTKQRVALVLIYVEGMSERGASEVMGISRGSARRHAERGLAKLRRKLGVRDVS